jgi:hypothetical protein
MTAKTVKYFTIKFRDVVKVEGVERCGSLIGCLSLVEDIMGLMSKGHWILSGILLGGIILVITIVDAIKTPKNVRRTNAQTKAPTKVIL